MHAIIAQTLKEYGFASIVAREARFADLLWDHICLCMKHSRYGIVVMDGHAGDREFNPNVSVELGYMLALGKQCLILKDRTLPRLPTDIVGHLYEEFDHTLLEVTVEAAIRKWLRELGHDRAIENISHVIPSNAKKLRTERILAAMRVLTPRRNAIVRQAGSLSSLAISPKEKLLESDGDPDLRGLLLDEAEEMRKLLRDGAIVRLVISPDVQRVAFDLHLISAELIHSDVVPRLDQLIVTVKELAPSPSFQIVYVARLPHDNVLLIGEEAFIGRRRLHDWGFPTTTIVRDATFIADERKEFDTLFADAARAVLGQASCDESQFGDPKLKEKVLEHLQECRRDLRRRAAGRQSNPVAPAADPLDSVC